MVLDSLLYCAGLDTICSLWLSEQELNTKDTKLVPQPYPFDGFHFDGYLLFYYQELIACVTHNNEGNRAIILDMNYQDLRFLHNFTRACKNHVEERFIFHYNLPLCDRKSLPNLLKLSPCFFYRFFYRFYLRDIRSFTQRCLALPPNRRFIRYLRLILTYCHKLNSLVEFFNLTYPLINFPPFSLNYSYSREEIYSIPNLKSLLSSFYSFHIPEAVPILSNSINPSNVFKSLN